MSLVCVSYTYKKQASEQERSVWHLEQKLKSISGKISKLKGEMATLTLWKVTLLILMNRLNQKIKILEEQLFR
jgi:hypothetical protein